MTVDELLQRLGGHTTVVVNNRALREDIQALIRTEREDCAQQLQDLADEYENHPSRETAGLRQGLRHGARELLRTSAGKEVGR